MVDAGALWGAQNTTPSDIDDALRNLLKEEYAKDHACAPARVLNQVVIVDREWRGEILNRLERVGRYHPSRLILCAIEPGRSTIDASVALTVDATDEPGEAALLRERILLDLGEAQLKALDTIVDPLVVPDIATLVWSPHGHHDAVDALLKLAQVVLVDLVEEPDPATAVRRALGLAQSAYVVDLAWLRSTPWRERVAASFDPPVWRNELRRISAVTVRHRPDSGTAAVLFFGWLATRLGWQCDSLIGQDGSRLGRARAKRGEVRLEMEPDPSMSAPGLAGVTVETASGMSLSLDRGPGGLAATRTLADGRATNFTVMGASRGEAGILGEGIRQALLRDHTYAPALEAASVMLS
jgi:glucose-6-phosphate dehydrogenase assembly protein OpcA